VNAPDGKAMPIAKMSVLVVCADQVTKLELGVVFKALKMNEVTFVTNTKDASRFLNDHPIDAVIVDGDLPDKAGYAYVKELEKNRRVYVGLLASVESLVAEGDNEELSESTLTKPISLERVQALLQGFLLEQNAPENLTGDAAYCKVNISDFVSGKRAQFDLYIRIGKNRFVKIAHQEESISIERINGYRDKDVRHLYIRKADFRTYVGFNFQVAPMLAKSEAIPREKKVAFVKHLGEVLIESCFLEGVKDNALAQSAVFVESMTSVLVEDDDVFRILNSLRESADFVFAHSSAVSLYSIVIAQHLGWSSPQILFKIGAAGLFHDVGQKEIDREILLKSRIDRTSDENQLYESHPIRGAQLLSRVASIPPEIVQVVMEHHENCLGHGFPQGLKRDKIHPIARLVALVDEFCHLILPSSPEARLSPQQALTRIHKASGPLFDPTFLVPLMLTFKMEVPTKLLLFYDKEAIKAGRTKKRVA
jgi:HD-GYP domain-containing protein (c-di-GMP phosphodiesterase class II)/CheY-like chemotaxis protein